MLPWHFSNCSQTTSYLDQFALCCFQCDHRHLAGLGADLVHQQAQPCCPGLPVLQFILGPGVVCLQAKLLALQQHLIDIFHPLPHTLLKPGVRNWIEKLNNSLPPLLPIFCSKMCPGVLNTLYLVRLRGKLFNE